MKFGIMYFPTDQGVSPGDLAVDVEDRGYESLWVTEHTHIPVERSTPWPGGAELPEYYKRIWDPFVALSAAATATSRLRLGTGICLVAQHHPLPLAKSVASLDQLSAGRVLFGVGVGWNREEMANHGVNPDRRRSHAREHVLALQRLWTHEEASFDGEYVSFGPSWSWPKPIQQPHPPVLLGGAGGPVTFRHVIEYCDGWMPLHGRSDVLARIEDLRRQADAQGRDPATVDVTVMGCPADQSIVEQYLEAGVDRCTLTVPVGDHDRVSRHLERHQPVLEAFDAARF